jgi:carbamoyl-phosphate synthase large subunit
VKVILVSGIGGPAGVTLAAQLAERKAGGLDVHVVGLDMVPVENRDVDALDIVAPAADPDYAASMLEAFARHEPDLVIPTVSDELPQIAMLAELSDLIGPAPGGGGHIMISPTGPSWVASDKLYTMWRLERAGLPVPRYSPATEFETTRSAREAFGGALVLKPRVSRGGRGVRLIETEDEEWPVEGSWIVQAFASGTEYCPQVYRSPVTGETIVKVLEKTVLKQGRVGNAAEVVLLAEGSEPEIVAIAAGAVEALELVGPVDMDVRRDANGDPVVLEVNGRFGANSAYTPELLDAVFAEWLGEDP